MAYTKYSLTPANNTATPPDGAPEGMLPSAVNDTMRDMMAQIRDCGDGIRDGTYTMTAAKITGGTITGTTVTSNTFSSSGATITGGTINGTTIGATTASTGKFTTLEATGVTTVQAGTVSAPAITTSGDTNTGIFFPAADTIAFTEGGAESMRIDSSGNVGIGNTPSGTSATGYRSLELGTTAGTGITAGNGDFYVPVNAYVAGGAWKYATTSTASLLNIQGGLFTWSNAVSGTAGNNISFSERMRITSGGEVYIAGTTDQGAYNLQVNGTGVWGAGAYVNGSDERIKDKIAPLDSGLDVVAKLNPVTYKYKKDWSKDQSTQTGFIAQELLTALEGKNYVDGVVQQGGEYMSVAYQNIIPILTKAIQEQQAIIEELKAKVTALENK